MCLFGFTILCVLCVSLDRFIPVLLAFVLLGLVSSVQSQEIWLGRTSPKLPILRRVGSKTLTQSVYK